MKRARWCGERTRRRTNAARGPAVGAEGLASVDLGRPVEADDAGAEGARCGRGAPAPSDRQNRLDDLPVARAAAQDAAEAVLDRGRARVGLAGQEIGRRQQHAGRADAALGRTVGEEGLLQRPQSGRVLDRGHPPPGRLAQRDQTGADLAAVEQDRARTAVAGLAADLGAGQMQLLAQNVAQPGDRRAGRHHRAAVDLEANAGFGLERAQRHGP